MKKKEKENEDAPVIIITLNKTKDDGKYCHVFSSINKISNLTYSQAVNFQRRAVRNLKGWQTFCCREAERRW